MNQMLIFPEDYISENKVLISDKRCEHIFKYLKPEKGNSLKAGLINGKRGKALITSINNKKIEFETIFDTLPPAALPLTLIIAMPRPKVLKRVIEHSTSLGIKKIFIIKTWRVEKSFWSSPVLDEKNLFSFMIAGLEQSGDTILPEISIKKLFKPFCEDEIPAIIKDRLSLLAHPISKNSCPVNISKEAVLAIGPEGGFIPYEIDLLEKQGFEIVKAGERILRVETIIPYLSGRLFPI